MKKLTFFFAKPNSETPPTTTTKGDLSSRRARFCKYLDWAFLRPFLRNSEVTEATDHDDPLIATARKIAPQPIGLLTPEDDGALHGKSVASDTTTSTARAFSQNTPLDDHAKAEDAATHLPREDLKTAEHESPVVPSTCDCTKPEDESIKKVQERACEESHRTICTIRQPPRLAVIPPIQAHQRLLGVALERQEAQRPMSSSLGRSEDISSDIYQALPPVCNRARTQHLGRQFSSPIASPMAWNPSAGSPYLSQHLPLRGHVRARSFTSGGVGLVESAKRARLIAAVKQSDAYKVYTAAVPSVEQRSTLDPVTPRTDSEDFYAELLLWQSQVQGREKGLTLLKMLRGL